MYRNRPAPPLYSSNGSYTGSANTSARNSVASIRTAPPPVPPQSPARRSPHLPYPPAAAPPAPPAAAAAAAAHAPPALYHSFSKVLLVLITNLYTPDLQNYLHAVLSRYSINETCIIATNDEALKAARMDTYAAAGKMQQDIVVTPMKLAAPLSPADLAPQVTKALEGRTLCGVLLCQHDVAPLSSPRLQHQPSFTGSAAAHSAHASSAASIRTATDAASTRTASSSTENAAALDILDYDAAELEASWRASTLTLHALARITVPLLRRAAPSLAHTSPFFYLDTSTPLNALDAAAQDALLSALQHTPASPPSATSTPTSNYSNSGGITVGQARLELVPPPPPPPPGQSVYGQHNRKGSYAPSMLSTTASTRNGGGSVYGGVGGGYEGTLEEGYESPPESPTKLWASWAMMNE